MSTQPVWPLALQEGRLGSSRDVAVGPVTPARDGLEQHGWPGVNEAEECEFVLDAPLRSTGPSGSRRNGRARTSST